MNENEEVTCQQFKIFVNEFVANYNESSVGLEKENFVGEYRWNWLQFTHKFLNIINGSKTLSIH
jgi:hypothetical protein